MMKIEHVIGDYHLNFIKQVRQLKESSEAKLIEI
jgi:hypothetical protein